MGHLLKAFIAPALLATTALTLSGCSLFGEDGYFRDKEDDYRRAEATAAPKLPEGIETQRIQPLYAIPEIDDSEFDPTEDFEVPRPLSLSSSRLEETVKIQKLGDRRWILVNVPPSDIWPQLRSFLSDNNLDVVYADTVNGILETSWIQFKDDLSKKDKFRLQIDQGVQPDTSEIHVTHLSVPSSAPAGGQVNWPETSTSPEREAILLDDLAANLATEISGGTSMLAQNIGGNSKVSLTQFEGEPVLQMALTYQRAWATLGYSTTQEGFTQFDSDMALGVYYIDYRKPVKESDSWFSWGSSEQEVPTTPYSISEVLAHLQLEDSAANRALFSSIDGRAGRLDGVPGYLLVVRGGDGNVRVHIRDGYGQQLPARDAKRLLKILRRNLI